jgi:hypothetical protein
VPCTCCIKIEEEYNATVELSRSAPTWLDSKW